MFETNYEKIYPNPNPNPNPSFNPSFNSNSNPEISEKFRQIKRKRLRRTTIMYKFIDYIVKNVFMINDNIGINSE